MAGCVQRNSVPVKIELEDQNGNRLPPEEVDLSLMVDLADAERGALFALSQWCDGSLSSFLQLNLKQTSELLKILDGIACFFPANQPEKSIFWKDGNLIGMSEFLPQKISKQSQLSREETSSKEIENERIPINPHKYGGPPIEVEGSTEYLRIILPSAEHPCYHKVLSLLRAWNFLRDRSHRHWWWLRDKNKVLNFLASHQADFELEFNAEFTDNFRNLTKEINHARLSAKVIESSDENHLKVEFQAGTIPQEEIAHALATGRNHVLQGRKVYLLTKELKEKATQLFRYVTGDIDTPLLSHFSCPIENYKAASIEEFILSADPLFEPSTEWQKRSGALKDLSELKAPILSDNLEKFLRPYQRTGVAWLLHLFRNDLGGILADEMGLGKTLQTLAFLWSLKKERCSALPSLVVSPASLIENWRRETKHFCPEFKVLVHHGITRTTVPTSLTGYDLIITSYGTLVKDKRIFKDISLLCVIGDEAQYLKNRKTQNAQVMSTLVSEGRILLTGTPIENNVYDLISLLEFVLPGSRHEVPSSSRGEERIWHEQRILKEAAPYLLRRKKMEVATELPEKIEQILHIQLSEEQRRLYQEVRTSSESELDQLAKSGVSENQMRMKALTQLLRLRQTCCDPRLVDENAEAENSSKLRAFRELLYNCLEGGHRILVFSQFVKVLQILKNDLEASSLPFCYLDGSSKDRMAQVDRFQLDESIPVFLISLKAGGTGLNLTGADVVVHYDPWWNPAVELQATDRAHRIGQDKVVTVYKFIASDTVEEKVLQLQQTKRKLLKDVFEESEAANLKLSVSDLRKLI